MEACSLLASSVSGRLAELNEMPETTKVPSSWASPSPELEVGLSVLFASAGSLSSGATKMSLLHASHPTPSESASLCKEMGDAVDHLVTSLRVCAGCGEPMQQLLKRWVRRVLVAVRALANDPKTPANAGAVWEACENVPPKTNRIAYRRQFLQFASELKDSIDEFSALEYRRLPSRQASNSCLKCLQAVGQLYKKSLLFLDERGRDGRYEEVALAYDAAIVLKNSATLLAEELYPPLDKSDLQESIQNLDAAFRKLHATIASDELGGAGDNQQGIAQWQSRRDAAISQTDQIEEEEEGDDDCLLDNDF